MIPLKHQDELTIGNLTVVTQGCSRSGYQLNGHCQPVSETSWFSIGLAVTM